MGINYKNYEQPNTEAATLTEAEIADTGAVASACACAAWWRAARSRFLSLSAGPQWRGRRGGVVVEGKGGEEGGREWGAPGFPMVQLNDTVACPP